MVHTPEPYRLTRSGTQEEQAAQAVPLEQEALGKLSLEVSVALIEGETLHAMLTSCTEALVHHLDAAFARIWILHEEEQVLELQASSGMYTHLNGAHARVPVGSLKIGLIAAERVPHLTNEVIGDPRVSDQEWAKREGMVAFAGYPLLIGERLIGVMAMFARYALDPAALQALATVSNSIALGVERVRMQEERTHLLEREQAARLEAHLAHQHLQSLLMQAPALICVLRGPQHIYELANPLYLQLVGQRDIIGKPLHEALPELAHQSFAQLLDQVYTTGTPFLVREMSVHIDRSNTGTLEEGFFNFVYQPSFDVAGKVNGILVHGVDVTELVKAREISRRSQQRLELAQLVGHIGTFEWEIPTNKILWTPELEALYGLPPGGFEGKYENWAQRVHPDDLSWAEENLREAVAGGPPYNVEFRVVWPDGSMHWMLGKGEISAYGEEGEPLQMIGVNIDITERKEVELQKAQVSQRFQDLNANLEVIVAERTEVLRQLNTELERSNQELQDFAYVASHDLQEPLRKIQAFGNLLEEEYGETLGGGKGYLDRMRNAAGRMRVLIDDLLTFSRVTTKAQPFVPVDLNVVVQQVIDDLGTRMQAVQGEIDVEDLPVIEADLQQMYHMFQNLMSNALKFHKPENAPVVKITGVIRPDPEAVELPAEQQCLLSIADNGIGFDEKYLDRIFTVFQRLHGKKDYEGTGIGLAVVRKIVERHGGTITAKSAIGEGATFLITLPAQHH